MDVPAGKPRPSADEALALPVAGNDRFQHGKARMACPPRETLAELAGNRRQPSVHGPHLQTPLSRAWRESG
jgi:hypothetical protein